MHALTIISAIFVISGVLAAMLIALDLRRRPQPMRIMDSVWVLTGLWAGPLGLWAYLLLGRVKPNSHNPLPPEPAHHMRLRLPDKREPTERTPDMVMRLPHNHIPQNGSMKLTTASEQGMRTDISGPNAYSKRGIGSDPYIKNTNKGPDSTMAKTNCHPKWRSVVLSTLHCGAGCTLADLTGEWFTWIVPISIGGSLILGSWVLNYLLALVFGIGFQYAAIRSMHRISPGEALLKAGEADFLSLTAWQAGMYGWMSLVFLVFFSDDTLPRTGWTFWFMMQIAMLCGFFAALPVNRMLIRKGVKHTM
ncbi:DUF4396 domain-containing protein [Alistipes putredinis]|uniref:DUF4396 domain-containing protein n=1 Tax=Alistipes putredinis TaxID=28117 RepID=UPI0039670AD9